MPAGCGGHCHVPHLFAVDGLPHFCAASLRRWAAAVTRTVLPTEERPA